MDMRSEQPFSHTRHSSMDGESRLHIVELARYVKPTNEEKRATTTQTKLIDSLTDCCRDHECR